MRRLRRSFVVVRIPSRVSPTMKSGSSKTTVIASSTFIAKLKNGFA